MARWLTCPACVGELNERVEHAAHCSRCGRYFADASLKPIVGQTNGESGQLVGVEPRGSDMSGVFGVVRPFVLREEPRRRSTSSSTAPSTGRSPCSSRRYHYLLV